MRLPLSQNTSNELARILEKAMACPVELAKLLQKKFNHAFRSVLLNI